MYRAIKLLIFPIRSLLLRLLPSLVLLYAALLPAQLSLFSGYDALDSVRRMYSLAQIFLPLSLLWPLFLYFLPVYGTQSREVLVAMGHPDGSCALLLWASHQIRTLPLPALLEDGARGGKDGVVALPAIHFTLCRICGLDATFPFCHRQHGVLDGLSVLGIADALDGPAYPDPVQQSMAGSYGSLFPGSRGDAGSGTGLYFLFKKAENFARMRAKLSASCWLISKELFSNSFDW